MTLVEDTAPTGEDPLPVEPNDADGDAFEPELPPLSDDSRLRRWLDALVVVACVGFVFWQLHPSLILADTTPTGGDMGAHVWAFGELRDNLLPDLRISGWTPDWYAGFPVFQFYMVVPFLAMVLLNAGVSGWAAIVPLLAGAGLATGAFLAERGRNRVLLAVAAGVVLTLGVPVPYGAAFKLVTVAGVVAMPASAYAFGRLAQLPYPTPALFSIATIGFLFDKNFSIYGGNIASTLAGEFAFSISLAIAIVYLGMFVRGMRTGEYRASTAAMLALVGLTHLLPAFFALTCTAVFFVAHAVSDVTRQFDWAGRFRAIGSRTWWLISMGATSGLLAAFWVLPFFWQRTYLNDMGWEKTAVRRGDQGILDWLYRDVGSVWSILVPTSPTNIAPVAALALVGAVLAIVFRSRIGSSLVALACIFALAFVFVPQGRLWNARILPFWYLMLYFLAAFAVGEIVRSLAVVLGSGNGKRPLRPVLWLSAPLACLAVLGGLGAYLFNLPFSETKVKDDGGIEYVALGGLLSVDATDKHFVTDWSTWNYTGYERKDRYPEYRGIVDTMSVLGDTNGCGMSLWEYNNDQNNYGTPMAMMLLPHWTDGCIGSMEGLYFEASSTTPFHFLAQTELSTSASSAQRDMPYSGFDIDKGVQHLQLFGVKYYLTFTTEATVAAQAHPDLTALASSAPWTVFEVADSPRVVGLAYQPAVTTSGEHQEGPGGWLCDNREDNGRCSGPALDWFMDPDGWDVALAASGPDRWQRLDYGDDPELRRVNEAEVSSIQWGHDTISFQVDEPGTPVLVKASYFPNWQVSGAEGPYRVAPNLMVVIPTDFDVTLSYGREPVDYVAILLTLIGLALVFVLAKTRLSLTRLEPYGSDEGPDDENEREVMAWRELAEPAPEPKRTFVDETLDEIHRGERDDSPLADLSNLDTGPTEPGSGATDGESPPRP